jgi:broad specificity phosphatase PhoE
MALITVIRHAQASFGAANYDKLSPLGHRQSKALGAALKAQGWQWPGKVMIGSQLRHRETLEGIAEGYGVEADPVVHPGLNEFDFTALLKAHEQGDAIPEKTTGDRAAHFRQLKATVLAWQADEIAEPPERYADFVARVEDARASAEGDTLMVSSGGAISQMIRRVLDAPATQQILLQLQMKNCAVNKIVQGRNGAYLHGFNETPHIDATNADEMLTYS